MSKLFTLKEWLSLEGAAERLSVSFGETVTQADIIQLALEGRLILSLRILRHLYARRCYKKLERDIEYEEVEYTWPMDLDPDQIPQTMTAPVNGEVIHEPEFCEQGEVLQLGTYPIAFARDQLDRHIVDLPLTRFSRSYLLNCLDLLHRDFDRTIKFDTYKLLIQEKNGTLWQIESYDDECLENEVEIVVRTQALRDLEQSLAPPLVGGQEKTLSTRERDTLYKIIIGLAVDGYGYDPADKRSTIAREVSAKLDELGIPVSDDTVRKYIKEAAGLLEAKPA